MKHELTLRFLLKATLACVVLTLVEILFDHFTNIHMYSRTDFEMIAAWIVVGIAWIIYLVGVIRKRKNSKEEPWSRMEKDPR